MTGVQYRNLQERNTAKTRVQYRKNINYVRAQYRKQLVNSSRFFLIAAFQLKI